MSSFEIIVQKSDMTDDTQLVGENGKFIGITKMSVDVELFCIRTGGSLGGHESVSYLVGVNIRVVLVVSL